MESIKLLGKRKITKKVSRYRQLIYSRAKNTPQHSVLVRAFVVFQLDFGQLGFAQNSPVTQEQPRTLQVSPSPLLSSEKTQTHHAVWLSLSQRHRSPYLRKGTPHSSPSGDSDPPASHRSHALSPSSSPVQRAGGVARPGSGDLNNRPRAH